MCSNLLVAICKRCSMDHKKNVSPSYNVEYVEELGNNFAVYYSVIYINVINWQTCMYTIRIVKEYILLIESIVTCRMISS